MSNELNPITREELFLAAAAGQDVTVPEPITRKEMFLAKLVNKDAAVPAAITRDEYFIEAAAEARNASVIVPLSITENGTYTASDGVAGYNPIVVDVAGSSAELRYVIFMSYDGSFEYGKKAVAVGDDCADPIARGIFAKPTRESDAQFNYTFYGWATTPNGAADSNALKAVNEDRTVYANFSAAVRYYTITYYDSDGTTVLKTESLAYGAMPSYVPTKENVAFSGWVPSAAEVTGNASYTAVWEEKITFATGSWAKISEICAAGKASEYFAVGDKKPITLEYDNGVSETINFTIVDMGVDPISGGGKAPLTIMADNIVAISPTKLASAYNKHDNIIYRMDTTSAFLNRIYEAMPDDLQAVIKDYLYFNIFGESTTKIFIAHAKNLGVPYSGFGNPDAPVYNDKYKYFANGASILRTKLNSTTTDDYWTAAKVQETNAGSYTVYRYLAIDGTAGMSTAQSPSDNSHGIVPCFCI